MHEQLENVLSQALGKSAHSAQVFLRTPLEFQSNRLYDVRADGLHLIAKEFLKPEEWPQAPTREFNALVRLASFDIAPRPVYFDPDHAPIVIYEYMDGAMWDRKRPSPAELEQLTAVWLTMHKVSADGLWVSRGHNKSLPQTADEIEGRLHAYAQWTARNFPSASSSANQCLHLMQRVREAANQLESFTPAFCFCKADPRFANVIQRPDNRLGLIDWEDSGLRDPARDIVDMMLHPNQEDLMTFNDWRPFLDRYLAERQDHDAALIARIHLYRIMFPVWWLSILLTHGLAKARRDELSGWSINGLPANVRLRRYLAHAVSRPDSAFEPTFDALGNTQFFPEDTL